MTLPALKRVAAVHDLSGFGKCSLTIVLPVLSAMGVEVAALPTAVLSTHTGDLAGYTYRDLTEDMPGIAAHWDSLGLAFDAVYTGFLGSAAQIDIVRAFIGRFRLPGTLVLVDPVMGDHGTVYRTYTPPMVAGMRTLCRLADVITPNLTEAHLLLGEPYAGGAHTRASLRALCVRLAALGPSRVVITGASMSAEETGAAVYDARHGHFSVCTHPFVPGVWYGTGDIFASVLLGALLGGADVRQAAGQAAVFTHGCIARTAARGSDPRYGVDFETGLAQGELAHTPHTR